MLASELSIYSRCSPEGPLSSVPGGHRQFVGPLLGFRGAFVEGGLILRFRIGSRGGGRFLPFFIGFRFQEGIGCEFLRQPFLQVEQRQVEKFQRLELARGELLLLPERGR
ncbi:MAG: hypothetical protein L6W00_19480 [Lentisphaeria bacterium]|nr:MAG: hypothetical protein L6W00_19480 [Lentisphaeria bacterium]